MVHDRIVKLGVSVLGAAIAMTAAANASAAWGPADDRQLTAHTEWIVSGKATDFSGLRSGFRVTDVHTSGGSPLTFSILTVENTGAYEVDDWGAFMEKTLDDVEALKSAGRRPIALHSYFSGDQELFAGATVANTGANFRSWELLRGNETQVTADNVPSGFRPMSIATPNQEGLAASTRPFTVLLVENVEKVAWMMKLGAVADGNLNSSVDGVNWGLVDVSPLGNEANQFAAIWYGGGHGGDSIFGQSAPDVANQCSSGDFRPIFLADFENFGSGTFGDEVEWASSMVENF